jgi:hypothetical protein
LFETAVKKDRQSAVLSTSIGNREISVDKNVKVTEEALAGLAALFEGGEEAKVTNEPKGVRIAIDISAELNAVLIESIKRTGQTKRAYLKDALIRLLLAQLESEIGDINK